MANVVHSLTEILENLNYDLKQNSIIQSSPVKYSDVFKEVISLWDNKLSDVCIKPLNKKVLVEKLMIYEEEILKEVPSNTMQKYGREDVEKWIKVVGKELVNFFSYQVNFYDISAMNTVKLYWDNLLWTAQGNINMFETAIKIIDHTNLSLFEKFELACSLCIEERIKDILKILPKKSQVLYDDVTKHALVIFWIFFVKYRVVITSFEVLMEWSIHHHKEAAVEYIFKKLDKKSKLLLHWVDYSVASSSSDNIMMYFFKEMLENQLRNLDMDLNVILLRKLHNMSSECKVKFVSVYVSELIKTKDIHEAFKIILFCWQEKFFNLQDYQLMWNKFSIQFKEDLERDFITFCDKYLNQIFIKTIDLVTAKLLLQVGSSIDKMNLLFSESTLGLCCWLLCQKGLLVLNSFIIIFLEQESNFKFKKIFFEMKSFEICKNLVTDDNYELVDNFMKTYCIGRSTSEFKKELAYKNNAEILCSISSNTTEDLLPRVDKFLKWSFEGNMVEIESFKIALFDMNSNKYNEFTGKFYKVLKELTMQKRWHLVEQYWEWILYAYEFDSRFPNVILGRISTIIYETFEQQYFFLYMRCVNVHELERFIMTCFKNGKFVGLRERLQNSDELSIIVQDLLNDKKYTQTDFVLDLCFSSCQAKVDNFKTKFMSSPGCSLLFELVEGDNQHIMSLMKWFNPCARERKMVRESFETYMTTENKLRFPDLEYIWALLSEEEIEETSSVKEDWILMNGKSEEEDWILMNGKSEEEDWILVNGKCEEEDWILVNEKNEEDTIQADNSGWGILQYFGFNTIQDI